jgi:hypothetical protein
MNWGKWILISFVLFAAFIATLVTVCIRQDIGLISKDYYKEELAYQNQIDRMKNTSALEHKPVVTVHGDSISVQFMQTDRLEGGVFELFSPSNSHLDRSVSFTSATQNKWEIPLTGAVSGSYRAKLRWKMDGKEFYLEVPIYL